MTLPDVRHPKRLARFCAAAGLVLLRYSGTAFVDVPYWLLSLPAWGPYALAYAAFLLAATGNLLSSSAQLTSGLADLFDGRNTLRLEEEIRREAARRDRRALKNQKGWPPSGAE